ncbi:Gemin2, partial [Symbiodinium pilosum]
GLLALFQAPEIPARFRHSEAFASDASASFRHLRGQCQPRKKGARGTQSLTYEEWRQRVASDRPDSQLLAAQDFVGINHLVVVAIDKFEADFETFRKAQETAAEGSEFQSKGIDSVSEWIFAVLAFVEEPLVDDIQYQLQRLRRICCRFAAVAETAASKAQGDGEQDAAAVASAFLRPRLALLLLIVADVFGQH